MSANHQNHVLEYSPFLNQLVSRHPDWLEELRTTGRLDKPVSPDAQQLAASIVSNGLDSALRQFHYASERCV